VNQYIDDFLNIIRNCPMDNTYKMAWAKAIVEISNDIIQQDSPDFIKISLEDIARKVFKYYWNQIFFFGMEDNFLFHGQNPNKKPEIVSAVKNEIDQYCIFNGRKPVFYEKLDEEIVKQVQIKKVTSTLKKDVSWRFLKLDGEVVPIYEYQRGDAELYIQKKHVQLIVEYTPILLESINYNWSMVLERFNPGLPNVCKKVRLQSDQLIKRSDLNKFRATLALENPEKICSICDKKITDDKELSVDHVIPWSYLYSNDLWNFLFAHKNCNSGKSNSIPNEEMISKLEHKNLRLLKLLENQSNEKGKKNKEFSQLEYAIEHGYVKRFWNMCRGF
jgi:HNH endonuclease